MDRRSFIAAAATGAGLVGAAAPTVATARRRGPQPLRQRAVLSGWLVQPHPDHPHLFALVADPRHARRLGSATAEQGRMAVWVHAERGRRLQAGQQVRLAGWLQIGRFKDEASGYLAGAVLADARPI
jgi:hypothetical protein